MTRATANKKKEDILQKTLNLFLEKGYNATSTNDICAEAGISKPTLYYYFKDKRHLFFSLHRKALDEVLNPYLKSAASIKNPEKRFAFMIQEYTKMVCRHPELRILIHDTLSIKDNDFVEIKKQWKKHYLLLCDTISALKSRSKMSGDLKASWVAMLLLGMVTWITYWFDYSRPDQIDEIAETALKIAQEGIGARNLPPIFKLMNHQW